jgi:hypothetical protein
MQIYLKQQAFLKDLVMSFVKENYHLLFFKSMVEMNDSTSMLVCSISFLIVAYEINVPICCGQNQRDICSTFFCIVCYMHNLF